MTVVVEQSIDIEAPADVVFELLTSQSGLLEWMAVEAESDVVVGGRLWWRHENGSIMQGRFVEVTPPTRVAFTYGWEVGPEVPPESTLVEIDLVETKGVTHLHLVHSKLPESVMEPHQKGWTWFLGKLVEATRRHHVD